MLNYIRLFGTMEQMHSLPTLDNMEVRHKTANELEDGIWEVCAYVDDAGLIELDNQGFSFDIKKTSVKQSDHIASLNNFIGENNQGIA